MGESSRAATDGEVFGRYLLTRRLGTGGMGVVHAARWVGPEGVGRPVCIKRVRAGTNAQASRVRMFVNEARLSMGLSHGNIVQTLDFGRVGDEYFLALELVDGIDLGTLLTAERREGSRMPPEVAAFVAAAICDGLAYAHERGVVHRDVKPGNVLLSRSGEVKIADFGVAALAAAGDRGARGTAAYMAPEQARGEPVDGRADLFSAGLVLHEMLTGYSPYGAGDYATVLVRAREARLPPLGDEVPAVLAQVAGSTAQRDPSARPSDAREVADALGGYVASTRAAGAAPPARWLAARVETLVRPSRPSRDAPSTATGPGEDERPATYFTRDGTQEDFDERMALTTRAEVPRPAPKRWIWALPVLAAIAVLAVLLRPDRDSAPARSTSEAGTDEARVVAARSPEPAIDTRPSAREPEPAAEALPSRSEGSAAAEPETAASPTPPPPRVPGPVRTTAPRTSAPAARPVPATLDVNAFPYARVVVDGVDRGETPLMGFTLPPGEHRVRLVHPPSGRDWTTRITLSPGERRAIRADLRERSESAASASTTPGATETLPSPPP